MNKKFDLLVFIGRFQPYHNGHLAVTRKALSLSPHVLHLIGSSTGARSPRNPFTASGIEKMIRDANPLEANGIHVSRIPDYPYSLDRWLASVREKVRETAQRAYGYGKERRIGLIGMKKDHTSFYLDLFPEWEGVPVDPVPMGTGVIDASGIRRWVFDENFHYSMAEPWVPASTYKFLSGYHKSIAYNEMVEEYKFLKVHHAKWAGSPYPPTFNTADAVVSQSGYVLMIRRRSAPGKGLLALPGGYVNQYETLEDSMLRELKEETSINVPVKVLRGSIRSTKTFDDPYRSLRGRIITQAYHIELPPGKLPKVKGGDDAAEAMWIMVNELKEEQCFEDHIHIIRDFLKI